jgi:hypothetical protein
MSIGKTRNVVRQRGILLIADPVRAQLVVFIQRWTNRHQIRTHRLGLRGHGEFQMFGHQETSQACSGDTVN